MFRIIDAKTGKVRRDSNPSEVSTILQAAYMKRTGEKDQEKAANYAAKCLPDLKKQSPIPMNVSDLSSVAYIA